MSKVVSINTGYAPTMRAPTQDDKREAFNMFAIARYALRKQMRLRRAYADQRREAVSMEEIGKLAGDMVKVRSARARIAYIDKMAASVRATCHLLAKNLLSHAHVIEHSATPEEKASLLGLSLKAAMNEWKTYGDGAGESFMMLLSRMPEGREDPDIEDSVVDVIIDTLMENPITHRQMMQNMNGIFGQEVFPVPRATKPGLSVVRGGDGQ